MRIHGRRERRISSISYNTNMCGISGFNWKDEAKIRVMVSCTSYRGPDASDVFVDEEVSLGHNRLAVIDLSPEANQPMFDNARELVIVFNGEIYNFEDVKKELEGDYDFKTKSDTEVILAGYRKWGKRVVEKLNGMFALAIWDMRDDSLFCARDHSGMKPFYYFWDGKRFIFASELSGILTHDVPRKLDADALNHYFRALYVPSPMTLIKGVYKLPPSHTATLKNGSLIVESYGKIETAKTDLSYAEATKTLREKTLSAVKRHLISDVPVGVYLSGGIDSSVMLASMSQFRKGIKTFSIGFDLKDGEQGNKFNQDFELAKKTAEFFGAEHHPVRISVDDALAAFDEMVAHNSDPISNPTSIAMMLLAKFAKKEVTVALTGNGGDELFGGYDRYRMALAASYYKKLPAFIRAIGNMHPKIAKLDYVSEADLYAQFMFEKDKTISRVIAPSVFEDSARVKKYFNDRYLSSSKKSVAERIMKADQLSWLPDHFFMLSDKMSMANSLEERMPLVDKELTAFADTLPLSYKLDLLKTKKILKDAFKQDLPDFLFNQPKRGWFSPAAKWLRNPAFSRLAREILSSDYHQGTQGVFNWAELREMLERHIAKEEYNLTTIWAAITLQAWARRYNVSL